jgi:hypothetical protein
LLRRIGQPQDNPDKIEMINDRPIIGRAKHSQAVPYYFLHPL